MVLTKKNGCGLQLMFGGASGRASLLSNANSHSMFGLLDDTVDIAFSGYSGGRDFTSFEKLVDDVSSWNVMNAYV